MGIKTTTIGRWLLDAKDLRPGDCLEILLWQHEGPTPTFADMRAALHAQFGADTLIRIHKHGQRISIFIHDDAESRDWYDARTKTWPPEW